MRIFLRIVEGVFWTEFFFWFSLSKIFSRIILKEVFVCVKIAVVSFFFCLTEFLMNGYRQMNLLFILFSFVQRTRQGKVFGRGLWLQKAVRCVHPLAEKFAFAWKRRVHNDLKTIHRRRAKEQSIHGQQDLMHRALGFIDKEYERLWFGNFMIFKTKICGFWVDFEANFKPSILKQDKGVWFSGFEKPENAVRQSLSAFQIVILLRMIPNSYAVKAVFRRKSRFLRIHVSVSVW